MRVKGKLVSWNEERGFGFIAPMTGGKQVFIHIKAFSNRNRRPVIGQIVTFERSSDKQGRPRAIRATLAGDRLDKKSKRGNGGLLIVTAVFFLGVVGLAVLTARLPLPVLMFYIGVSAITFITYALDKSAARTGAWRTKENTLHLLSLVGGWPGALVAQQRLRHKTRKQPFQLVFWVTVLINFGVFVWLFTPDGSVMLDFWLSSVL
ncbi:DNA-binding protein [Sedimenticola thiotaurini]|uniref:DNA-binding protein n=1 Tax=Sedimenticola thiotaurini TaxID=1543721 RepID=A0A0F7K5Z8_9GAMM|nr:DNA-binding protein [Sedimenticola thiotaurini]